VHLSTESANDVNGISVGVGDGVIVGSMVGVKVEVGVKVACLVLVGMGVVVAGTTAVAQAESNIVIRRKNERDLFINASLYIYHLLYDGTIFFLLRESHQLR
jgi:uncharacterized membrane protein (Fun14 family)